MNINKFWTCWAIVSSLVSPLGVTISTPTSEWQAVITWPISRSWCLEKGDWWILAAPPSGAISRQLWLLVEQSSTYYALLERVPLFTVVELIILSLLVLRGRELICVRKSDNLVLHVYQVSCLFGATGKRRQNWVLLGFPFLKGQLLWA